MAFSLRTLFGAGGAQGQALAEGDFDEPTTQVKMSGTPKGYDPLGAVSIMEQMRTGATETVQPTRLWFIGHLPIVRQFQILGILLVVFTLLAVLMLFFNTRITSQVSASVTTATEMQMLSQRLARNTSLAAQGNAPAFGGVKDSRDRFRADLDAPTKGGTGTSVRVHLP